MRRAVVLILGLAAAIVSCPAASRVAMPAEPLPLEEDGWESVLGIRFVSIPLGEFLMGSPRTESGRRTDETQHRVRITKPFLLAIHEVTLAQFRTFVGATGYQTSAERDGRGGSGWNRNSRTFDRHAFYNWRNPGFAQEEDHPVVNVSWNDAQEFCRWLSRLEQRSYRLPTEAEWEYACRAGTTTQFSSGNQAETLVRIGNVADRSARQFWAAAASNWTFLQADDGYAFTCPVGKFQPNAWGLYDMHGNVWEWCEDRYGTGYYQVSPLEDPLGPAAGNERVCRGGSWGTRAALCRAAFRNHGGSDESQRFIGFRLALEPTSP